MSEESMDTVAAWRQSEAVAVRAALSELVRSGAPELALDASGVDAVDGCGLQLLLACRNDLAKSGRSLTLLGCSQTLARSLDLVGLTGVIERRRASEPR